jgi:D-aspartate ligase
MEKRKVIVLGLSIHGATLLRNLSRSGYEVWGATHNTFEEGLLSGHGKKVICPNPESDFRNWLHFMKLLSVRIKGMAAVIPTSDVYVMALDRASEALNTDYRFHKTSSRMRSRLTSKFEQLVLAHKFNFPFPKWKLIRKRSDLVSFYQSIKEPIIIKPEFSHYWHQKESQNDLNGAKVMVAKTASQAGKIYDVTKPYSKALVAEEMIPGPDRNLLYWAGFVGRNGKVAGRIVGQKTRVTPMHLGSASFVELVDVPELETQCENFLRRLGFNGLCGIEVKRDSRDGRLKLIEINPRIGLWEDIGIPVGVDLARQAIDDLYGDEPAFRRPTSFEQKWVSLHRDVPVLPHYLNAGETSMLSWLKSLKPPIVVNDFPLFSDPKYVFGIGKLFTKKILRRLVNTDGN